MTVIDPNSPAGKAIIGEAATMQPTTLGDPPPPNPRQAVYDAMDGLSDPFYLFLLSVMRPVNRFVANTIADDPTAAQKLEDAITAEYIRFGVPKD